MAKVQLYEIGLINPGRRHPRCVCWRSPIKLWRAALDTSTVKEGEKMASRTTTSGGDYNLSDPLNSFVDVVRRVVLQPTAFFAGLPRQGSFLGPLVFALICIEVSVILVGLLTFVDVPGGVTWLFGARGNQGFLAFVGGLVIAPIAGTVALRVRGDLPDRFLLLGDEPSRLATFYRVDLLLVPTLPGNGRDPRDARNDHGQGAAGGAAAGDLDPGISVGGGRRIGHCVLQGCLMRVGLIE